MNGSNHLPEIGATEPDALIAAHYAKTRQIGPYEVWELGATTAGGPR